MRGAEGNSCAALAHLTRSGVYLQVLCILPVGFFRVSRVISFHEWELGGLLLDQTAKSIGSGPYLFGSDETETAEGVVRH